MVLWGFISKSNVGGQGEVSQNPTAVSSCRAVLRPCKEGMEQSLSFLCCLLSAQPHALLLQQLTLFLSHAMKTL